MKKTFVTGVKVILLATLTYIAPVAADHFVLVDNQLQSHARFHKSGLHSKADSALAEALAEYSAYADKGKKAIFRPSNKFLQVSVDRIVIDARATDDGIIGIATRRAARKHGSGRPPGQTCSRSPQACGRTGLDYKKVRSPRPCVGCDLLPVWTRGMLDGRVLDAEESGEPRARHSTNC